MKYLIPFLSVSLLSCSGIERQDSKVSYDKKINAVSDLHSASHEKIKGLIKFEDVNDKLKIDIEVTGLNPFSTHGLHIHEEGICEGPAYKSAGDHFNPHQKAHGGSDSLQRHIGDLGNIKTDANGVAKKVLLIPKQKTDDLNLLFGKSVLLHAQADDLKTQPSGNSGSRIACGLIKPVN